MKTMSAKGIRFILLAVFFLLSVCFGAVFLYINQQETEKTRVAVSQIRRQLNALRQCRESLNSVGTVAGNQVFVKEAIIANELELKIRDFRRNVGDLLLMYESFPEKEFFAEELSRSARNMHTAALSCIAFAGNPEPSAKLEFEESMRQLFGAQASASESLQTLSAETEDGIVDLEKRNKDFSNRLKNSIIAFIVTAFLLILLVSLLIEKLMRKSLHSLSEGTKKLRDGNMEYRFTEITPDEIGEVKYDFNMMARRIEQQSAELVRANGELRRQAEDLIEAHQHKDRFLSNMSHELRTPLNSIIGFSELIQERADYLPPEKLKGYSARVLTAAEHLLSLITSLLDLAKSDAGTLRPVFAEFDLTAAIAEMISILRPLAGKKSLSVEADLEPGLLIHADQRMIKQIFINLMGNAVKFTERGGIKIRLYRNADSENIIEVEDTGIGIKEEDIPHLFKDFHRVEAEPGQTVDGVGIGLALSRRLAALHNGTITLKSRYGKGSVFTLTLPTDRESEDSR